MDHLGRGAGLLSLSAISLPTRTRKRNASSDWCPMACFSFSQREMVSGVTLTSGTRTRGCSWQRRCREGAASGGGLPAEARSCGHTRCTSCSPPGCDDDGEGFGVKRDDDTPGGGRDGFRGRGIHAQVCSPRGSLLMRAWVSSNRRSKVSSPRASRISTRRALRRLRAARARASWRRREPWRMV